MANNNKHITTSEIVWIRQLSHSYATSLSSSKISVVFNILYSHPNTNLSIRPFSDEKFLVSKYLSILHTYYAHNPPY